MKNLVWSLLLINVVRVFVSADTTDMNWPVVTKENKPWSYWWWMGNAVDDENLTDLLEQYQAANFGGLHIIPIYGVKGEEERYIDFLSRSWMDRLAHTVREARRLDMGVDMSTGTGWPFGGPMVTLTEAAERILLESYSLGAGETLDKLLPGGRLVLVQARNDAGEIIDVTDKVKERRLAWTPAEGNWRLYVLVATPTGQKVKRAAPGGQGRVLNPYSHQAMLCYLQAFDKAFVNYTAPMPRAQYHDSFEYFRANWMDDFFQEFHTRRGYDLREYLPAFFGEGDKDAVARVKGDYRRTISDLHIEYIKTWAAWAHGKGCLARDQAHGAPANLLDTYAAADIPETEIFGPSGFPIPGLRTDTGFNNEPPDPLALKFASSAAHVAGHPLCSSETCTWLGEHFQVALSQAKPEVDQLFICGVNHIFYHGMAYSPLDEAWPGWLFYASTSFAPSNTFWRELGALNKYITRCQSILQSGSPANDILLYYPIEDIWHDEEGLNKSMSVHSLSYWLHGRDYYKTGQWMWEQGYGFDYVSDAQLQKSTIQQKQICTEGGQNYQTIIVVCHLMPVETQAKLFVLANEGAAVIFVGGIPEDVSGWGNLARQRQQMHKLWENVTFNAVDEDVQQAVIGKGCLLKGANLSSLLKAVGVKREKLADTGLKFIRRKHDQGYHYFITNL
ncbi:MAG: hypothetical protein JW709_07685, partial [Sedimentisphaerales bacterium]|nr:hypothetical protein [Sedimentisphaerales bacterium]